MTMFTKVVTCSNRSSPITHVFVGLKKKEKCGSLRLPFERGGALNRLFSPGCSMKLPSLSVSV